VLILHEGRILADDSTDKLQRLMSETGQVVAEIAAPAAELEHLWEQMPEVEHFDLAPVAGDYTRCALTARAGVDLRPEVFRLVKERGWTLRELTRSRHSLEDIFVRVTRPNQEEEGF
jgi:ABC-2 type transport system ATP-binding protein